jgi:carboxymethylenebutenolidase
VLPRIKARLYFGHAVNDPSMPAEAIEKLGRALASWGDEYHYESYDGAYRGWTTPGVPVYKEKQGARAFDKLTELFTQTLK